MLDSMSHFKRSCLGTQSKVAIQSSYDTLYSDCLPGPDHYWSIFIFLLTFSLRRPARADFFFSLIIKTASEEQTVRTYSLSWWLCLFSLSPATALDIDWGKLFYTVFLCFIYCNNFAILLREWKGLEAISSLAFLFFPLSVVCWLRQSLLKHGILSIQPRMALKAWSSSLHFWSAEITDTTCKHWLFLKPSSADEHISSHPDYSLDIDSLHGLKDTIQKAFALLNHYDIPLSRNY